MNAQPNQMTLDLQPLPLVETEPECDSTGRPRITSVQILTLETPWWEKAIAATEPYQVVAVYRGHNREYRSYAYRPGLRHARAMRVAGRR